MDRSDVAFLISTAYTTDSIGQRVPTETSKMIFCSVRSVTASEFFEAGRSGLNAQYRLSMFAYDYSGELTVKYKDVRYGVYRTYRTDGDTIELYLEKKAGVTNG